MPPLLGPFTPFPTETSHVAGTPPQRTCLPRSSTQTSAAYLFHHIPPIQGLRHSTRHHLPPKDARLVIKYWCLIAHTPFQPFPHRRVLSRLPEPYSTEAHADASQHICRQPSCLLIRTPVTLYRTPRGSDKPHTPFSFPFPKNRITSLKKVPHTAHYAPYTWLLLSHLPNT
jgi:hypothetical protein